MTRVYPVIHVADANQVLEQVSVAARQSVAGVFLIDHDADDDRLNDCIQAVHAAYPQLFLGANFIRRSAPVALEILAQRFGTKIPLDAIWADSAGTAAEMEARAHSLDAARRGTSWGGLHFGGVAFKYQTEVPYDELPELGRLAHKFVDVPTTSGPGTGQAADATRLKALRSGLGDHQLALASGVTPDNVGGFTPLVDHILVSTGINNMYDRIDEGKLASLLSMVQEGDQTT